MASFTARHSQAEVDTAWRSATGPHPTSPDPTAPRPPGPAPIRLPLPRAALYEGWNTFGWPPLGLLDRRLRDVDLIHAPSVAVPPRSRGPLIVTVHDVAPALFPEAFPWHGRWFHARGIAAAARRADLVITVSESAAAEIQAGTGISRDRIRIVANGVDHIVATPEDVAAVKAKHGLGESEPYILWVGTVEPRKNVATLLRAFAQLDHSGHAADHRLVLAGPSGWLSDGLIPDGVWAQLGGDGPDSRVRLLGQLPEAELRALYAGATLFALPSKHEGFGLPVLEAMVQGTPVLCARIPALLEVSGGAARLVSPTDVDAWADALGDLLGHDEERRQLAAAGRAWSERFSWEQTVRQTRTVYAEALTDTR